MELTTVADDEAVAYSGTAVRRWTDLRPDTEYDIDGVNFRTLPRPGGERLATVATVNDVHLGETECGLLSGVDLGPVLRSEPGAPPYPEVMAAAAVAEIAALRDGAGPTAVVAKGDLTSGGRAEEYERFREIFEPAFGGRLSALRGNHDAGLGPAGPGQGPRQVVLDGVVLALLDTVIPGRSHGRVGDDQLEWLDELGAGADRPVLVFGHHHVAEPFWPGYPRRHFGIEAGDAERLVDVVSRRPALAAYLAGHTHRNRVGRLPAAGDAPWVEVACVKDFPGAWAEYRVFEGGILQIHRRIADPEALAWTERTRVLFGGLYPAYAFGTMADRCFPIWPRPS